MEIPKSEVWLKYIVPSVGVFGYLRSCPWELPISLTIKHREDQNSHSPEKKKKKKENTAFEVIIQYTTWTRMFSRLLYHLSPLNLSGKNNRQVMHQVQTIDCWYQLHLSQSDQIQIFYTFIQYHYVTLHWIDIRLDQLQNMFICLQYRKRTSPVRYLHSVAYRQKKLIHNVGRFSGKPKIVFTFKLKYFVLMELKLDQRYFQRQSKNYIKQQTSTSE